MPPRGTATKVTKPTAAAEDDLPNMDMDDDGLPDLPDSDFDAIDQTLAAEAAKVTKKRTKKDVPEKNTDDLPAVGFDDDPSTEMIGNPLLDQAALAGVHARLDSLVEQSSDYNNAVMNRFESIVTTLRTVFDGLTNRFDGLEQALEDLKESFHPILKQAAGISVPSIPATPAKMKDITPEVMSRDTGLALLPAAKIMKACKAFTKPVNLSKLLDWLVKCGMDMQTADKFCMAAGLQGKESVGADDFPWA